MVQRGIFREFCGFPRTGRAADERQPSIIIAWGRGFRNLSPGPMRAQSYLTCGRLRSDRLLAGAELLFRGRARLATHIIGRLEPDVAVVDDEHRQ